MWNAVVAMIDNPHDENVVADYKRVGDYITESGLDKDIDKPHLIDASSAMSPSADVSG